MSCILNYGCEVWGYHPAPNVEKVHLYFLKRILKVKQSTVNSMVYCELGRLPMYIERHCKMIKYWIKLLNTENCILKYCYEDMFEYSCIKPNDKQNWCNQIKNILFKYGFNYIWYDQYVDNVDYFLFQLKERMMGSFISEINSFLDMSPKCQFYKYMYNLHCLQFYLDRPINYVYKPYICKYRICAHNLNIEVGRYHNIDRNQRYCTMCNTYTVEDEYHFILECKKYDNLRKKYIKGYYWRNPSAYKLIQLLSVENIKELNNLGKFLYLAEKTRNG